MGSFPESADPNCQGGLEFVYEAYQLILCTVTVSVPSLGQGTHFALDVLQALFLNLACLVFQNKGYLPLKRRILKI